MTTKRNLSRAVRRAAIFPRPEAAPAAPLYFEGRDELERILMGRHLSPVARDRAPETPLVSTAAPLVARFQRQTCDHCGHESFPFVGVFEVKPGPAGVTYVLATNAGNQRPTLEVAGEVRSPLCPLCTSN